jgi:hypothetical protein
MINRMLYFYCLFFSLLCFSCAAQTSEWNYRKYGKLIRVQLKNAPFPHPDRAEGHEYKEKKYPAADHYQDSTVLVFVPKHFKPSKKIDFIVHFHGWRNNTDSVLAQFRLIEQLDQSKKNAILVIPQGPKNAPDSHAGKMEQAGAFGKMMNEILIVLHREGYKSSKIGNIVLSAHSGGHRAVAYILLWSDLAAHVREVYIFDGLYAELEKFTFWLTHTKKPRFINIYTEEGGTKKMTQNFITDMKAWKMPHLAVKEEEMTAGQLESNRIIHIFTALDHNEVIHLNNQFYKFILTSPNLK